MTPSQIIALVRDAVIVAALGFIVWRVYAAGENAVKASDVTALQKQLVSNAAQSAAWQKEQTDAEAQRQTEMAGIRSSIASQRAPVLVCSRPTSGSPVPGAAAAPAGGAPAGGPTDGRPRGDPQPVDVRPLINQFELKYEAALASCRAILNQWPVAAGSP